MARRETIFSSCISVNYVQHCMNRVAGIRRSQLLNGRTDNAGAQEVGTSHCHNQQSTEKQSPRISFLVKRIRIYADYYSDKEPEVGYCQNTVIHKLTVTVIDGYYYVVVSSSKKRLRHNEYSIV